MGQWETLEQVTNEWQTCGQIQERLNIRSARVMQHLHQLERYGYVEMSEIWFPPELQSQRSQVFRLKYDKKTRRHDG